MNERVEIASVTELEDDDMNLFAGFICYVECLDEFRKVRVVESCELLGLCLGVAVKVHLVLVEVGFDHEFLV